MKLKILFFIFVISFFAIFLAMIKAQISRKSTFQIKSIDTMKYSRDLARETLRGKNFDYPIERQVSDIAKTGATHIAIGTPYDNEFLPVMKLWVKEARKNKMKVYFRGNFSGWEGWFGYPHMDMQTHMEMLKTFVSSNPDLFEDGDIFSTCPECENGAKIDIYKDPELKKYRDFIKSEYQISKSAFKTIHKNVKSNYYSMNLDASYRVMDRETVKSLDGLVVIDHYVDTPEKLNSDISAIARVTGGQVFLGEFGAPIPGINGNLSEREQEAWLDRALGLISKNPDLIGVNYWVNLGGSTALWHEDGKAKSAVKIITDYFN